jgi:hypothetical protein
MQLFSGERSNISNTLFVAGLFLICTSVLVLACFAVAHKSEIAKGIGFGVTQLSMKKHLINVIVLTAGIFPCMLAYYSEVVFSHKLKIKF